MGLLKFFSAFRSKPAASPAAGPAAGPAAAPGAKRTRSGRAIPLSSDLKPVPAPPRNAPARPAVAPVGARGETDLAPSRAATSSLTFPSTSRGGDDLDRAAIRELFGDIAAGQAAPVKTFMSELRDKRATTEWLEICRPVMTVLVESATSLGFDEASRPMSDFVSALDLAAEGRDDSDGPIDGAARDVLLEAYESLAKALPEAFALSSTDSRRETMLLHAIVKQVDGVGIVTLDALYGAGITSLRMLTNARPEELASTTGVPLTLCRAICAALRAHHAELSQRSHLPADERCRKHLGELLLTLVKEQAAFTSLETETGAADTRAERKRAARKTRNLCALKIEATLLEMCEFDRADAFRALPFDRRIDFVAAFLGASVGKRAAEQRQR
jgi:hypothetical protein